LKVCSDGNDEITGGSMFQTLAVATGKAWLPMVFSVPPDCFRTFHNPFWRNCAKYIGETNETYVLMLLLLKNLQTPPLR